MSHPLIYFDFSSSLDYFLPGKFKGKTIELPFKENQSLKHLIESFGIPHTEVGLVKIDNQKVDMATISQQGIHVFVYSVLESDEIKGLRIEPKFVLDNHLGTLTRYLRLLGFDCIYENHWDDETLAILSHEENRVLLSRDRRLLMRSIVKLGYCLRSLDPIDQLREVIGRFSLRDMTHPFGRCTVCNNLLEDVPKELILDKLEPLTREYFNDFKICKGCDKIYWKGSHYVRIMEKLQPILNEFPTKNVFIIED